MLNQRYQMPTSRGAGGQAEGKPAQAGSVEGFRRKCGLPWLLRSSEGIYSGPPTARFQATAVEWEETRVVPQH